jgi:hypothetical protein
METGFIYLAAALALIGFGIWIGLAFRADEVAGLNDRIAGLQAANADLKTQGQKMADTMGAVLRNARERANLPATPDSVRRMFKLPPDPAADSPARGTARPSGPFPAA